MNITRIGGCRLCGNQELVPLFDLGVMALTGIFSKKDEGPVPEGPLELVKCHGKRACGLVQLRHSFDPNVLFGASYGYRSSLNESMRRHLGDIAGKVRRFLTLSAGDVVVDIGSNDGTLLNFFSGEDLFLLGVDPTACKFRRYYHKDIQVIPELFTGALVKKCLGERKAKVVTGIAVFYDIDAPLDFLRDVREILSDDGICVLEQSYLPLVLENIAYDTICHEHAAYYRLKQVQWLAERTGLKIIHCEENQTNGGSFCVVLAKNESGYCEDRILVDGFLKREERMSLDTLAPYAEFWGNISKHRKALRLALADLRAGNKQVFGYGASTKGNVLLQFCGLTSEDIPYVADINEDKWGRFCPGTRIPIISEKEAMDMGPDVYLVLPWHFRDNFLSRVEPVLKSGGGYLFPLPEIDMVVR